MPKQILEINMERDADRSPRRKIRKEIGPFSPDWPEHAINDEVEIGPAFAAPFRKVVRKRHAYSQGIVFLILEDATEDHIDLFIQHADWNEIHS